MSWESCMYKHIKDEWGETAANCVKGFGHGDLPKIVKCIEGVLSDADPAVIAAKLAGWSISCLF